MYLNDLQPNLSTGPHPASTRTFRPSYGGYIGIMEKEMETTIL